MADHARHEEQLLEQRFIEALRRQDEAAFNALVLRFQDRIFNLTRRLIGSHEEARDVTQEVFVTVFEKISTFRGESSFATWLYRIATNHAKNRIKYLSHRADRRRDSFDDLVKAPTESQFSAKVPGPDEAMTRSRVARLVDKALGELEEEQRIVLVLRDIEGQNYEDIALITGMNLGTVKSRLHRGRLRLKELLLPHIDPNEFASGGNR